MPYAFTGKLYCHYTTDILMTHETERIIHTQKNKQRKSLHARFPGKAFANNSKQFHCKHQHYKLRFEASLKPHVSRMGFCFCYRMKKQLCHLQHAIKSQFLCDSNCILSKRSKEGLNANQRNHASTQTFANSLSARGREAKQIAALNSDKRDLERELF